MSHDDGGGQDAFHHTPVERQQGRVPQSSSPQPHKEVQALMCLPIQAVGLSAAGEAVRDV